MTVLSEHACVTSSTKTCLTIYLVTSHSKKRMWEFFQISKKQISNRKQQSRLFKSPCKIYDLEDLRLISLLNPKPSQTILKLGIKYGGKRLRRKSYNHTSGAGDVYGFGLDVIAKKRFKAVIIFWVKAETLLFSPEVTHEWVHFSNKKVKEEFDCVFFFLTVHFELEIYTADATDVQKAVKQSAPSSAFSTQEAHFIRKGLCLSHLEQVQQYHTLSLYLPQAPAYTGHYGYKGLPCCDQYQPTTQSLTS